MQKPSQCEVQSPKIPVAQSKARGRGSRGVRSAQGAQEALRSQQGRGQVWHGHPSTMCVVVRVRIVSCMHLWGKRRRLAGRSTDQQDTRHPSEREGCEGKGQGVAGDAARSSGPLPGQARVRQRLPRPQVKAPALCEARRSLAVGLHGISMGGEVLSTLVRGSTCQAGSWLCGGAGAGPVVHTPLPRSQRCAYAHLLLQTVEQRRSLLPLSHSRLRRVRRRCWRLRWLTSGGCCAEQPPLGGLPRQQEAVGGRLLRRLASCYLRCRHGWHRCCWRCCPAGRRCGAARAAAAAAAGGSILGRRAWRWLPGALARRRHRLCRAVAGSTM